MTKRRILIFSLLISMAVWSLFSWPLPRHIATGIPSSSANVEKGSVRQMIMGDHLQLLYNYWIFSDMLSGKTRFFHNLYEFNTGDDDARRYVGFDFMPFTAVFTLMYWIGGRAFAWNMTTIFSIWITYFFSWLLLRRFIKKDSAAAITALAVISLPYLWSVELGGSPTGFAMSFIPMLLWGIDYAIRSGRVTGGLVAALALLCSYLNDAHVLLFSFMIAPCWAAFVLLQIEEKPLLDFKRWIKMTLSLLPFALAALFIFAVIQSGKGEIADTTIENARGHHEVAIFSPDRSGLYSWDAKGISGSIYLGFTLPLLFIAGLLAQLWTTVKSPKTKLRETAALLAIFTAVSLLIMLALGPNGPHGGKVFGLARRFIPNYDMIRQPAKIFSFMPIILAAAAALSLKSIFRYIGNRKQQLALLCIIAALFGIEYKLRVEPTVCIINDSQSAYAAVAEDAKANGHDPRAIVIPIWPGDSAWSSLYEHYSSLYRIRMINGYLPVIPNEYIKNIYQVFEYMNGGIVTDAQLDNLLNRGIEYVLLHEDAFPEQVSSFAVSFTLKRFLDYPRLKLLQQGENIWAFKILPQADKRPPLDLGWNWFFPSYNSNHEIEWFEKTDAVAKEDSLASGGRYVSLEQSGAMVRLNPFYHCNAPNPVILLRGRGHGPMVANLKLDNGATVSRMDIWDSDQWHWREIRLSGLSNSVTADLQLVNGDGSFDLDLMIFSSGSILGIEPGKEVALPAPLFFHAGYTDLKKNSVVIRKAYESAEEIFYGPNLPLSAGEYEVIMRFDSQAEAGTNLGSFSLTCGDSHQGPFAVIAGNKQATGSFKTPAINQPLRFAFKYSRAADLEIKEVVFKRLR